MMSDNSFFACKPPAVPVCDASGCRCEVGAFNPAPAPAICPPSTHLTCGPRVCVCEADGQAPIVNGEPVGPDVPDGCTLLLAIIIAGVKKSLVACWVNG